MQNLHTLDLYYARLDISSFCLFTNAMGSKAILPKLENLNLALNEKLGREEASEQLCVHVAFHIFLTLNAENGEAAI